MVRKIRSLREFKEKAKKGIEYFILLNFGGRSSKHAIYKNKNFYIENYIDGSEEVLNEKEFKKSNSYKALERGALFVD